MPGRIGYVGHPGSVMCSVDGCQEFRASRGLCQNHYKRWQNHGHTGTVRSRSNAVYCDCETPTPGWWKVECNVCYRLIEGAIPAALTEGR